MKSLLLEVYNGKKLKQKILVEKTKPYWTFKTSLNIHEIKNLKKKLQESLPEVKKFFLNSDKKIHTLSFTYLIKAEYNESKTLVSILEKNGWEEDRTSPDFLYLEGKNIWKTQNLDINSFLVNRVDKEKKMFTDKGNLSINLKGKSYIPTTHFIDLEKKSVENLEKYLDGTVWILKPVWGFSGKGIKIIKTKKDLKKFYPGRYKSWVLQKYIEDPMLLDGYKFHLRCLFLLTGEGKGYYFKFMPIYLATEKFTENYKNLNQHDTHFEEDQRPLFFPGDIDVDEKKINRQISCIFKDVIKMSSLKCMENTEKCYEVFGADFLIDAKQKVYLIEINEKIGLRDFKQKKFDFNELLFKSQLMTVVDKFFPLRYEYQNYFIRVE